MSVTHLVVRGRHGLSVPLLAARLTLALLHHHHSLLPHLAATTQGHGHGAGPRGGTAGAGAASVGSDPDELPFGRDEEGAALAETQLVVHGHRVASLRRHSLERMTEVNLKVTAVLLMLMKNQRVPPLIRHVSFQHQFPQLKHLFALICFIV